MLYEVITICQFKTSSGVWKGGVIPPRARRCNGGLTRITSYNVCYTKLLRIANTTPSAAIVSVFSGLSVSEVTFRGTGIDDAALAHKVEVIERGIALNCPDPGDPVDVLAKVGGFEIGGIAGLVLGCAALKIPVVVDGRNNFV